MAVELARMLKARGDLADFLDAAVKLDRLMGRAVRP
jgi:hypothetical protein